MKPPSPATLLLIVAVAGWVTLRSLSIIAAREAPAMVERAHARASLPVATAVPRDMFAATARMASAPSGADVDRVASDWPMALAEWRRAPPAPQDVPADALTSIAPAGRPTAMSPHSTNMMPIEPAGLPGPSALATSRRSLAWSGAVWAFLRSDAGGAALAAPGELGGTQAGLRIQRALAAQGRWAAFARVVTAGHDADALEGAVGVEWQPSAAVPVRIAAERRQRIVGSAGRSDFALYAVGGGQRSLPGNWRLDAYGAAGVVGTGARDGFAESAIQITHPLRVRRGMALAAGAVATAAAQPGASRADIGPRVDLTLGDQRPVRLSVDWRQRIAGSARPDSGIAITLAADF